ncbi:unnamed protein product, partial [Bubo scandiacus]
GVHSMGVQLSTASGSASRCSLSLWYHCDNNLDWGVSATGVHPEVLQWMPSAWGCVQ